VAMQAIAADPEGEAAQAAIAELLRATPGFEKLKQNLADEPQREPGIITRQGRLINANTRAVALGDLGREYIEVMVLPADATIGEIYDLELDLQVAEDYRQDYTFTNELLFVEDLIVGQGRNEQDVAVRLRWATPTKQSSVNKGVEKVRRYVRHLALIRDIQQMSGDRIPLTEFDDAEQALQELDSAYEALRDRDPVAAQRLKQARTLGLLVDLGYKRQRLVDAEWVEGYLAEALEENEVLGELLEPIAAHAAQQQTSAQGTDLEDFEDFEEVAGDNGSSVHDVIAVLTTRLGETAQEDAIKLPTAAGEREFDRELVRDAINDAMRTAAEDAKNVAKAGSALNLPIHLVEDVTKQLVRARQAYGEVSSRPEFQGDAMRSELEKAARALEALRMTVAS
jgi:hypothetical protein